MNGMVRRWLLDKLKGETTPKRICTWLRLAVMPLLVVAGCLIGLSAEPLSAQDGVVETGRGWSAQAKIPGYFQNTLPPKMVADRNRSVHAFATMPLSDDPNDSASLEDVIYYSHWTLADGWGEPNDILLSPLKGQARVQSVFLDKSGIMHLVFFGGDEQAANIYYSWAPATLAGNARAWTKPTSIGSGPITPDVAGLVGDDQGNLVVVYSGNLGEGNSLYAVNSEDSGANWSRPLLIYSTYLLTDKAFDFQMSLGASGALHVVWNVTNFAGQNVTGYYTQLSDLSSQNWRDPMPLDANVGLGIAIPAVIEYQGTIIVMYNNGLESQVAPVQWMRRSDDGGQTWSRPIQPFPTHIGRNGSIALVVDGADTLHVFFGQRTVTGGSTPPTHGMWHSIWNNGWGPLTPVASGLSSQSFDPYDARAVVSQGNTILVTWRTDPGRDDVWPYYSTTVLDIAESPLEALPEVVQESVEQQTSDEQAGGGEVAVLPTVTDDLQPVVVEDIRSSEFGTEGEPIEAASPAAPLVGALVPTVLFIIAALLIGSVRRRR